VPTAVSVERLVVEEGFLDGLDLTFAPGLNVIIGPRGVGKTSVIQLLRFCLGVPAFGEPFQSAALAHARNILGEDGRVSVRLLVDGEQVLVSRRKRDERPEGFMDAMPEPIVLAQTEIEEIGVDPEGRLRLLDDFRSSGRRIASRERACVSAIRSLTLELADLDAEIMEQDRQLAELLQENAELKAAEDEVSAAEQSASAASEDLQRLDVLGRNAAAAQARLGVLKRTAEALEEWQGQLAAVRRSAPSIERWPSEGEDDPLKTSRDRVEELGATLDEANIRLQQTQQELRIRTDLETTQVNEWEDEARRLRRTVEEVQEGAGVAVRRLAALRQRVAQQQALSELQKEQQARREKVRLARDQAVQELDAVRDERFAERVVIAKQLNDVLGPRIDVSVQRSGLWRTYAEAIGSAIRGSGLHYTELAPQLAKCMSPREFAVVVEQDDAGKLASRVSIPEDRARRIIDRVREAGLGDLLSAEIEDAVELKLLDGGDYKRSEDLSTGQRCTTILPIILRHEERPVIIDQPEDHLDGAFIVDTLVEAIIQRGPGSQLITSTHNPNVPVLGNAARVTLLGSNGHRGFEAHSGDLEDHEVVRSITSVMEGGKEAFDRRADFYRTS